MTGQEIFDSVLAHLRKQGEAAVNGTGECMYRGLGGTACAVGCLIPDELYDPRIEDVSAEQIMNGFVPYGRENQAPELLPIMARITNLLGAENATLLSRLQGAHDVHLADYGLLAWEAAMAGIAADFALRYAAPTN